MWRLYLGAGLLIAFLPSQATSQCDVNGNYPIDSGSSFDEMTCNFERGASSWRLARVVFPSNNRGKVKVTCTTINGDIVYTRQLSRVRKNTYISISDVDPDIINGANCSIVGCFESDLYNHVKIPTRSCIIDFDECLEGNHNCSLDITMCVNTPRGSYTCECNSGLGYIFNSTTVQCTDIDECETSDSACASYGLNAECINTDGSYECPCASGYRKNDTNCENIDECAEGTHDHSCSINAECIDTEGSYSCNCTEGFQGNGQICEDIDECETGSHICTNNDLETECINTDGSYECRRIMISGYDHDDATTTHTNLSKMGTQVDDGETVAGLIAALVVLSLVLIVVVAVFFALCTIYIIRRRKDYNYGTKYLNTTLKLSK